MEENLGKNNSLKKEFESLLAEDLSGRNFKEGEIVTGTVEEIGKNYVYIDLGLKTSSAIPIEEFKLSNFIKHIKKDPKMSYMVDQGWAFHIRYNEDDDKLAIYDPNAFDDKLIFISRKEVKNGERQIAVN